MSKFEKALEKLNICLNKKQLSQFQMYYEMLIETNKVMNLTAITEYDEVVDKHFVDTPSDCKRPLFRLSQHRCWCESDHKSTHQYDCLL